MSDEIKTGQAPDPFKPENLRIPEKTLIVTVGLPRSGKSTWARQQGSPIVNPDAIRLGLHGRPFAGEAEPFVWAIAKTMVRALFLAGHDTVILDATNTTSARRADWVSRSWKRRFVIFGTPDDTMICLERAGNQYPDDPESRDGLIGAIERMAERWEGITAGELAEWEPTDIHKESCWL